MLHHTDHGDGPPVVLLHGGALDHRLWDPQIADLARTHRVVAPDLRGHGASPTPTAPFRHADDVAALLRALDLGPTALVGISLGARTAVDVALEAPELVERLVVSGAGAGEPEWRDPATIDLLARWRRAEEDRDPEAWIRIFLALSFGIDRPLDDVDPAVLAHVREMAVATLEHHVPDGPPVLPTPVADAGERARELEIPVLAIVGLLDAPDHQRMAREVAHDVVEIEGAAHYPNLEAPGTFNRALLTFLREQFPVLEHRKVLT
ncbi:alpha/beta fold hydrolase [Actinomycetospora flava]|uniref:Alpha/beta fold hydrolase n=1 Tax=Actinomycetospora flava TaxID=3129232 RepID=A0ABU8MA79_9PSEU